MFFKQYEKQPTSETFGPDDTTQVDRYPIYKQIQSLATDYQSRLNNVKNVIKEKREENIQITGLQDEWPLVCNTQRW